MTRFTQSIKFKIVLAFGTCVVLMAAIGLFGAFGLFRLNSNIAVGYSGNTEPIADLSELRAASLDIGLQTRRILASRDQSKMPPTIEAIRADQERIDRVWNHYYPDGLSTDKEREIAEKIKSALPQMKAAVDETIIAFSEGNYEAAVSAG
ncbi:hypothetical protein PMI16_03433, partial [Herbaspirillum sp. CF444]|uniref:MCP four helix bundle domain-containing protein n=1 Tax=Herbaspirillum sp. CF444 TaxID=1144319 RepID=UPI0002727ED5